MTDVGFAFAILFAVAMIFLGGVLHDQGNKSDDCDNYGKSRIDGTWYECREIKSPLANGKQEG